MSTSRKVFADAVNAAEIPDITAYEYVVGDRTPGVVYPRLERTEWPNKFAGLNFWNLVLILPQNLADAERYAEDVGPAVKAALDPHMTVTSVEFQQLDVPGVGLINTLFTNGHRIADRPT